MVKAAQDGHRYDAPERLHRSAERCILTEGQVRADTVAVAGVGLQHAAKMHFAKYYEVVEAFPTDRADEPLYMTAGRPARRLDFQRQNSRRPPRCQRTSVSGRKIIAASSREGNNR